MKLYLFIYYRFLLITTFEGMIDIINMFLIILIILFCYDLINISGKFI